MISHVSELENLNTVHITILPETIYRFIIPIKIPTAFFVEMENTILKFIQNSKESTIVIITLGKERHERLTLPYFKTYY